MFAIVSLFPIITLNMNDSQNNPINLYMNRPFGSSDLNSVSSPIFSLILNLIRRLLRQNLRIYM